MSTPTTQRFADAFVFAHELHAAQIRKGSNVPYVAHLMSVSAIVLEHGGDEDLAIAALLHDAVEDQGGAATREQIRARFGERVAAIVDGCTDSDVTPKPPWRKRKELYIAHLATASDDVRKVSMSDKLHNARSILGDHRVIGDALWERFTGGKSGTLWYYRALVNAYRAARPDESSALLDELERTVAAIEARS